MSGQKLKPYTVYLRRRGGNTKGRVEVMATCDSHAAKCGVKSTIAVSYPKTKPADWIVTATELRAVQS
jgi:hypothetical protein